MSAVSAQAGAPSGAPTTSVLSIILRYGALFFVDAVALFLVYRLAADGVYELAIAIFLITLFVNVVNVREDLYPIRWMSPAIALMLLMVVYPIIYTVYVSTTNYGDGHLLTKTQAINYYLYQPQFRYLPETGVRYQWWPYQNEAGQYALWLTDPDGNAFFAEIGEELIPVTAGESGEGPFDDDGLPASFDGYTRLDRAGRTTALRDIDAARIAGTPLQFGPTDDPIGVQNRNTAGQFAEKYRYDTAQDAIIDNELGTIYYADNTRGSFVAEDGTTLLTGFRANVGLDNFTRFLTSPVIRGPLLDIFVWTVTFALMSVFSTFTLGLLFALLLRAKTPGARIFRTLLIVPYAIPALISTAIWKGMLNPQFGVLNSILGSIGLQMPPMFSDPNWAKIGILLINLWLGYPYFMLVCSGALAAIPSDMYEAAEVDGASTWAQFWNLTLPLLLVAVGPLLIASFTFNFNNFVIIDVYNEGGPVRTDTVTPAGYTDILISYAFRLAFGTGRGADFGLASAITIIIFLMVAAVTLLQFRFTRSWEETSKNV